MSGPIGPFSVSPSSFLLAVVLSSRSPIRRRTYSGLYAVQTRAGTGEAGYDSAEDVQADLMHTPSIQ